MSDDASRPVRRNRSSLWVLGALFAGLLLGALIANAGDGWREPRCAWRRRSAGCGSTRSR